MRDLSVTQLRGRTLLDAVVKGNTAEVQTMRLNLFWTQLRIALRLSSLIGNGVLSAESDVIHIHDAGRIPCRLFL